MNIIQDWPEPVVRVQSLSERNLQAIPDRYIKPLSQRPILNLNFYPNRDHDHCLNHNPNHSDGHHPDDNIPIIDLTHLCSNRKSLRDETLSQISKACREWGFFQVVNHGISPELMDRTRESWREFFHLPMEMKQIYANSPRTYEGYGSRLGVEKGAILDWSDYYFLHYLPSSLKDHNKWPSLPLNCREIFEEYGEELLKLCERLMKILSKNLGLKEDQLQKAFGGEDSSGACLRVNYYPKCPQPDLTLGLSSHSDPGGMTLLLPDDQVSGLQVRRGHAWITVKPVPHAFIVNIGDQIQVLSNAIYKSVEHRVMVNSAKERLSLAFFYNPKGDVPIEPLKELVSPETPPLYPPMTFNQYRLFIRTQGPRGKSHVDTLRSPG